jgi:Fic family protein
MKINEFLRESNAIEGVYDEDSLKQAKLAFAYLMSEKVMTPSVVLATHKILMLHLPLFPNEKGYFRNITVYIGGKAALNAVKIREHMDEWCEKMNETISVDFLDLEKMSRELHVEYEGIHPFVDGNGRTGRMFMNWHRINKLALPLLTITEDDRHEYYKWFV